MGEAEHSRGSPRGFTLIEILAVVVIIGIVIGVAVISINVLGGHSTQGQTALRLAGRIQLASENARVENLQYGLRIRPHHYQFMVFNGHGQWTKLTKKPVLGGGDIPQGMRLSVRTAAEVKIPVISSSPSPVAAGASGAAGVGGRTARSHAPQIAILSTGAITPFTLRLTSTGGKTYVIRGRENGRVHVVPPASINAPAVVHYRR